MLLVIGYDKEWDFPLELAFPPKGGDFIYVNEERPVDDLLLTRALKARNGHYHVLSKQKSAVDFITKLYDELSEKPHKDTSKNIDEGDQNPTQSVEASKNTIFVSYSHADAAYMRRLKVFLKDYSRQGLLKVWVDTDIPPGEKWLEELTNALRAAKAAVLLLSADFFASDFIMEKELPELLKRAKAGELKLILVVLSPCDFGHSQLSAYQTMNPPSEPLGGMSSVEQDKIWEQVKRQAREA
jgi:hypothetical protein